MKRAQRGLAVLTGEGDQLHRGEAGAEQHREDESGETDGPTRPPFEITEGDVDHEGLCQDDRRLRMTGDELEADGRGDSRRPGEARPFDEALDARKDPW